MGNPTEYRKTAGLFGEADLNFDVVILLVAGMAVTLTGLLLFPVSFGLLPYYENGVHGLLLFLFGLQTVSLGRTPAGDLRRSGPVLAAGIVIAAVGILACFVPVVFTRLPRMLLALCLGLGGLLQLLQLLLAKGKLRAWRGHGGLLRHLATACGAVYLLSMVVGFLVWGRGLLAVRVTALAVLAYGAAILALALLLQKIYRRYPEAAAALEDNLGLTADRAMLLLTGVFMLILGVLLVPVTFGRLPFSGSAQLGLLMVIFAIQMLAFGSTPVGFFPRSWLMVLLGLLFAALGIVSCVVPDILAAFLTLLVGLLNFAGGGTGLARTLRPMVKKKKARVPAAPVLVQLTLTQLTLNLVALLFGASMLFSGLLPGWVVGVILTANGGVLLYLMRLLAQVDRMRSGVMAPGS